MRHNDHSPEMDEELREKMQRLFCQHCKALQKSNDTVVECWYNPLDHGMDKAFCAASVDAINGQDALYKEAGYVRLDPEQTLPENPYSRILTRAAYKVSQDDMVETRWRQVILEE